MNISIIIPTKNRPNFIIRLLDYYLKSGFKGDILICDASDKNLYNENKKNILKYQKGLKIQHFYDSELLPDEANSFLTKQVKTEFCVYVADDDIILVPSLLECINFLNQNPDYSAVHGDAFLMSLEGGAADSNGKVISFGDYRMATSTKNNSLDRIEDWFNNMYQMNMCVIRTSINVDAFNEVNKLSKYYANFIFCELVHGAVVLARGKVGKIKNAYLIRQANIEGNYKKLNITEWHLHEDYNDAFQTLKATIEHEIISKRDCDENEVSFKTSLILSKWQNDFLSRNNTKEKILPRSGLKHKLKILLKKYKLIRSVVQKIKFNRELSKAMSIYNVDSQNEVRFFLDLVEKK